MERSSSLRSRRIFIREASAMMQVHVRVRVQGVVGQLRLKMDSPALATVVTGIETRCAFDSSHGCSKRLSTAALLGKLWVMDEWRVGLRRPARRGHGRGRLQGAVDSDGVCERHVVDDMVSVRHRR